MRKKTTAKNTTDLITGGQTHEKSTYSMILMSSSDKTTISVAVKTLEGADILNWGSLMAACAIVVVPSIIFFCFIQNKMAGGLSDGAVK